MVLQLKQCSLAVILLLILLLPLAQKGEAGKFCYTTVQKGKAGKFCYTTVQKGKAGKFCYTTVSMRQRTMALLRMAGPSLFHQFLDKCHYGSWCVLVIPIYSFIFLSPFWNKGLSPPHLCCVITRRGEGGGLLPEKLGRVCGPFPKTLTLF